MGILDNKSRILDFQLTDAGKELMSKGRFNVKYYRFFDDGIDYSLDEDDVVNDMQLNEVVLHETKGHRSAQRPLCTIHAEDAHVKPSMTVSKTTVTLRKQQQESDDIELLSLDGALEVYVETEDYSTKPPVYVHATDMQAYVPAKNVDTLEFADGGPSIVDGTDSPFGDDINTEDEGSAPDVRQISSLGYKVVHGIDDPQMIELNLIGASIQKGFIVEVFYSGSSNPVSGSENNLIKLSEYGVAPGYGEPSTDEYEGPNIKGGYSQWFSIYPVVKGREEV